MPKDLVGGATLDGSHIVATYSALPGSASDGEIFEVTNDEHQNGQYVENATTKNITTRYKYSSSKGAFELVWVDLAMTNNPLSSVIQTNSFLLEFTKPFKKSGGSFVVDSTSTALAEHSYSHIVDGAPVSGTANGIWLPISDFKGQNDSNTNMASFVTFDNNGNPQYKQDATMFSGEVTGYTYLGITVDYYSTAVEYLSSYFLGHTYLNAGLNFKCDWVTKI